MSATDRHEQELYPQDEAPKKSASPVMTETKAQAEDTTFRIVGEAGPLWAALALAQGAFQPIKKNREVTVRPNGKAPYTFEYATLDNVLAATVPALSANGLALLQPFYHGPNGLEIRTILAHASGARLEAVTELPKVETIQAAGSSITYLKRYQVQAILGVSSEEDDDGNAADGNKVEARQDKSRPATPPQRKPESKPEPRPQAAEKPPQSAQDAPKPSEPPPPKAPTETAPQGQPGASVKDFSAALRKLPELDKDNAREVVALLSAKPHTEWDTAEVGTMVKIMTEAAELKLTVPKLIDLIKQVTPNNPDAGVVLVELQTLALADGMS